VFESTTDIDLVSGQDIHMTATAAELHATAGTDIHLDAGSEFRVKTRTPTSYIESPTINVGTDGTTTDINLDSTNMDLGVRLGTTITMKGTNITLGTVETGVTTKLQGDDIEINPQNSGTIKAGTSGTNNSMTLGYFTSAGDKTSGTMAGWWSVPTGSRLEATYADLAERYHAEKEYDPGTVVKLGGSVEITETNIQCDPDVLSPALVKYPRVIELFVPEVPALIVPEFCGLISISSPCNLVVTPVSTVPRVIFVPFIVIVVPSRTPKSIFVLSKLISVVVPSVPTLIVGLSI
jgi:hypothetical protein